MKDIRHLPIGNEDLTEFTCERCGTEIPQAIGLMTSGIEVVEIGGGAGFVPYDDTPGSVSCKHPSAKIERERAEQVYEAEELESEAPELQPGEEVKEAHPTSNIEKMVTKAGFQNFLQMREATRLQE